MSDIVLNPDERPLPNIALVSRALREGWAIPSERKKTLITRLFEITETRVIGVPDADGNMIPRADVANAHAIAAARVIVAASAENQTDFWNQDKNERLDDGKLTERHAIAPTIIERPI